MANGAVVLERASSLYRGLAVMLLNTAILFVLVNIAALPLLRILGEKGEPGALAYGMEKLKQVYPGYGEREIRDLLQETWERRYVYEPFVQFKEGALSGQYVNIHEAGFRIGAGQAPWPPSSEAFNIFFFGGSTAFGYGLPDSETIAVALEDALTESGLTVGPLVVYNFGRSNYYSTQERVLFEQLGASGIVPNLAIFLDGLNDAFHLRDEPKFTGRLAALMKEKESDGGVVRRAIKTLPLVRLLRGLRPGAPAGEPAAVSPEEVAAVVERWRMNRRLISAAAEELGTEALFVWQPVPTHGYDLSAHLFYEGEGTFGGHGKAGPVYELMDRRRAELEELRPEAGFLWLGDLQEERREPLYVDRVHYTAAFSHEIAAAIADYLRERPGRERLNP